VVGINPSGATNSGAAEQAEQNGGCMHTVLRQQTARDRRRQYGTKAE
jgi:hypothetical protein